MADRKTVQKLMKEIAEDHPEFNNIEFDEAVFRACFEQALPLFPYNPVSEEAESCLRDFAKCFWNYGGLYTVENIVRYQK